VGIIEYSPLKKANPTPNGQSDRQNFRWVFYQAENGFMWGCPGTYALFNHRVLALQAMAVQRCSDGMMAFITDCDNVSKKPKWTRLLIIDSQAVKRPRARTSIETKGLSPTNAPMASAPSRGRYVGLPFYGSAKTNITGDRLERVTTRLLSRQAGGIQNHYSARRFIIPIPFEALQALYP